MRGFGKKSFSLGLAFVMLALVGCMEPLYRGLPEQEANEIVALLLKRDIEATKVSEGQGESYQVLVDGNRFADAVLYMKAQGYPRRQRQTLGDLFKPSGLIPTPFEERVRFIYGLSEEISHTISLFEGVIENRVHLVLPSYDNSPGGGNRPQESGKASVYIKYDEGANVDELVPKIKKLVSDSIEGVVYERVELIALPSSRSSYDVNFEDRTLTAGLLGGQLSSTQRVRFWALSLALFFAFMVCLVGLVAVSLLYYRSLARPSSADEGGSS